MQKAADTPLRADATLVLRACADEAQLVSQRFTQLEAVVLLAMERSGLPQRDPLLQEALQDMDLIAQHIETLRVILSEAAKSGHEAGMIDLEATIRAVRLEVVARRLADAMSSRAGEATAHISGEMELL